MALSTCCFKEANHPLILVLILPDISFSQFLLNSDPRIKGMLSLHSWGNNVSRSNKNSHNVKFLTLDGYAHASTVLTSCGKPSEMASHGATLVSSLREQGKHVPVVHGCNFWSSERAMVSYPCSGSRRLHSPWSQDLSCSPFSAWPLAPLRYQLRFPSGIALFILTKTVVVCEGAFTPIL